MQNKATYNIVLLFFIAIVLVSCGAREKTTKTEETPKIEQQEVELPEKVPAKKPKPSYVLPEVKREFRAAWVATVANINWPSKNNLSVEAQKREAEEILDLLESLNFNAVVFQARPSADALYKSDLEPWSYYLTGQIGKEPSPYYDPLEFWIEEAHKRGMELHVWLNPYRAHHTTGGVVTSESMAKKMSLETYRLRNGMYWMDPSDQKVQDHVSTVIKDIVKRYDIDAIHIDDYFYPYKEYHGGRDFPDQRTWNAYQKTGGTLTRADWRRGNVNGFIKRIYDEIKSEKKWVKFGISPFGIWKPGYPYDVSGSSQYDELYADAKLWLNEGWVDYFAPQLYWKEEGPQRFSSLLAWWQEENTKGRHLWPGLNTVGIRGVEDKAYEISNQILTTRRLLGKGAGEIHYSVDGIKGKYSMINALREQYKDKAIIPSSPWLSEGELSTPIASMEEKQQVLTLNFHESENQKAEEWIIYSLYGDKWTYEILSGNAHTIEKEKERDGKKLKAIAISYVDRLKVESPRKILEIKQ